MEKNKKSKEKEYLEDLQRLQAEFDNYRKRVESKKQEIYADANKELIFKLLNILDSLELALKHNNDKGIEMIYSQLYSLLENEGLKVIEVKGKFNPEIHEALITEKNGDGDKIVEELQKGYLLNGKVIRPSKVKIGK